MPPGSSASVPPPDPDGERDVDDADDADDEEGPFEVAYWTSPGDPEEMEVITPDP